MLVQADRMLHDDGTLAPGWVRLDGEVISDVGRGPAPGAPDVLVSVLSPGLVDVHCHGGGGGSFATTDPAEARLALDAHRRHGTTTTIASLVTAPHDVLLAQVAFLASLTQAGEIAGTHLEGPWLSPAFCGAHDPALLEAPLPERTDPLIAAGRGTVRMVTLAPELEGGIEAVRRLSAQGVHAAVGHTDADETVVAQAVEAGSRMVTHLFNAMRPIHHRAPGPVPTVLDDPRVTVELVADGAHVHPLVLDMASRAAAGGFVLVTDAIAAALAPDGRYVLGELEVIVTDGVPRLASNGSIAGSTLTLHRAVQVMVAAGAPLERALVAATSTPADLFDLSGPGGVGRLTPGLRADLLALTDDLEVTAVMRAGTWLRTP